MPDVNVVAPVLVLSVPKLIDPVMVAVEAVIEDPADDEGFIALDVNPVAPKLAVAAVELTDVPEAVD